MFGSVLSPDTQTEHRGADSVEVGIRGLRSERLFYFCLAFLVSLPRLELGCTHEVVLRNHYNRTVEVPVRHAKYCEERLSNKPLRILLIHAVWTGLDWTGLDR